MIGRPDFSPRMLRLFLQAHIYRRCEHRKPWQLACDACRAACKTELRRAARVTRAELDRAVRGVLRQPAPRNRLWGALGHVPADHGIRLLPNGKQDPPAPDVAAALTPAAIRTEGQSALEDAKETLNDMEATI